MKKIMALLIALTMFFSTAVAEVTIPVPAPVPTQAELEQSFLLNIFQFLLGTDLKTSGVNLNISNGDQQLFNAILQQLDDIVDLDINISGTPVCLQASPEGLCLSIDGQIYKLSVQNVQKIIEFFSDMNQMNIDEEMQTSPSLASDLLTTVWETVIVPSYSYEEKDGIKYITFDLNEKRIVSLGDKIIEDKRYTELLSTFTQGIDPSMLWKSARSMLQFGLVKLYVKADIIISDTTFSMEGKAALPGKEYSMSCKLADDVVKYALDSKELHISGQQDLITYAYESHVSTGDGYKSNVVFLPTADGWEMKLDGGKKKNNSYDISVVDSAESFVADFIVKVPDIKDELNGKISFDKGTYVLTGNLHLMDQIDAVLDGKPTDIGYKAVLDTTIGGQPYVTVDCEYSDTEIMNSLKLDAHLGETPLVFGSLAYAKKSGAYELYGKSFENNAEFDAKGVIKEAEQSCVVEIRDNGELSGRFTVNRADSWDAFTISSDGFADLRNDGKLRKLYETSVNIDKLNGSFSAFYRIPVQRTYLEVMGLLNDSVCKLKVDSYGKVAHRMDISCVHNDDMTTGEASYSGYFGNASGKFLWSPYLKTVSATSRTLQNFNATLLQDVTGAPKKFQATLYTYAGKARPIFFDIFASDGQVLMRNNGQYISISSGFEDKHTYTVRIVENEGGHGTENLTRVDFTADRDALVIKAKDDLGVTDFNAVLTHVEKHDFVPLFNQENVLEITPEYIMNLLMNSGNALQK